MKITEYFIKHPVIALVINAMVLIIGLLCFNQLSLREYPLINFSTISVNTTYPNASADIIESTVTNVLEDNLAGIEGLMDMKSTTRSGQAEITLDFNVGISMDRAMSAVRDAVSIAMADLPKDAKTPIIKKKTVDAEGPPFMAVSIRSNSSDFGALTHYANLNLKNAFRSIPGVSAADIYGQQYTYEVTLDPNLLYTFGVNADEVYDVLNKSSHSLPVGKFQDQIPTTLITSLNSKEDYENLVIRPATKSFPAIFLRSVATIIQKTDDTSNRVKINGKPGIVITISRGMSANPVDVSNLVNKKVAEIKQGLPNDMRVDIVLDQAEFVRSSIDTIKSSIIEAIVLVLAIVFLFLRSFRATFIPLVTIPISLAGSMLFLSAFGCSINMITLLAMVLAIGLVVDDAIVVLENIARHIEEGLKPLDAAIKGGREIGFAVLAMTFTLVSVFAPIAFIQGAIGQLFVEFAVALAGSVFVSGMVALTLSPLMCASFLKSERRTLWSSVDIFLNKITAHYENLLTILLTKARLISFAMLCAFVFMFALFNKLPTEMTPKEDRSLIGVWIPPIPGKDINALDERIAEIQQKIGVVPEAENVMIFMGNWGASLCFGLTPKNVRKKSSEMMKQNIQMLMNDFPSVDMFVWSVDSGLPGLDTSGGSDLKMVVSTVDSYLMLYNAAEKMVKACADAKTLPSLAHDLNLNSKSYTIDLDANLLGKLNLDQAAIAKLISIFFSSDKTLNFNKDGISYVITIKGQDKPWTLDELYITNNTGNRISLGTLGTLKPSTQPDSLFHYNQMRSLTLTAQMSNASLDHNMNTLKTIADTSLPPSYKKTWIGMAKVHKESALTMMTLIFLAIIFIYAVMAIQFESFLDPLMVMLTVPLAAMGALFALWATGQTMNIYTQIGLITLIGLITKNGILIVEFANQQLEKGMSAIDAVKKAASLRLRPILMTTSAMILGALPLILSNSSGSETRRVIGAVLVGGLSFGTLLTLIFLPTIYAAIKGKRF
ncbi:MAG: efflux RND transporter permease subunit [Candidatus Paracaedibacteraceae bacterium]|nr:efflux RND transporter permease subunit [Candidatus Paracaedibacteraceae bacterium]